MMYSLPTSCRSNFLLFSSKLNSSVNSCRAGALSLTYTGQTNLAFVMFSTAGQIDRTVPSRRLQCRPISR